MCYSAQIWADYRRYVRGFGATLSVEEFFDLFWRRNRDPTIKIPRAMEAAFNEPTSEPVRRIKDAIAEFSANHEVLLQRDLFRQRERLADAERTLLFKSTKKALNDERVSRSKIASNLTRLSDLHREEMRDDDSRIFPKHYAPVMVAEDGKRVIKPMRYLCRPAGKPAHYDIKYPGTYNARRDSLPGFWKGLFGYTHGVVVANVFYENVNRHRVEGRDLREDEHVQNVVLEFKPRPSQDMLLACLWSHWKGKDGEPDLLSFALVTDDPPNEVQAAGHDRCVIPIKPENLDVWLNPDPMSLATQYAILDDRSVPYFDHRSLLAA